MSVGGLMNIGSSALRAAYAQLQTTGHNISNVNTPGYNRQEVVLASAGGNFTGSGFIGRGVDASTVVRRYDRFLAAEVNASASAAAGDTARADQLGRLERMFADTENGIGVAIDDLMAAFADVANRPFDNTARTVVISRAGTLAERIRGIASNLEQTRETINQKLMQATDGLNSALSQLSTLNERISKSLASGHVPNDLLDQRDLLVETVNKSLKTTTYTNPDGTLNLFSATGQALVVGGAVARFAVAADPNDASKLGLVLKTSGNDVAMPSEQLGGGELSGLLRFRDQDLEAARARLGQISASLAWAYNTQQSLGTDPAGAPGAAMFAIAAPQVSAAAYNTGNAVFAATVVDGSKLAASDYQIGYNGSGYTVTRLSDGSATAVSGWPQTIDGLRFDLGSGSAQPGDRFLVRAASTYSNGFAVSIASPARIATGFAMTPVTGTGNGGDTAVRGFAVTSTDPNLREPVTITFDGAGTFSVSGTGTGNPSGLAYTPGMTIGFNGWSLQLSGVPAAGDTISIEPTANPATDNRNARAMLALGDAGAVEGRRFVDAFAEMLADVGIRSQSASASASFSKQMLVDAQAVRSSESGVNLDEEAARLLQYQQAYQAAAKLIQTAQTIFDDILRAAG